MKISIYGTGAVGGFIGSQLALAGLAVSAVDRGPNLEAIQTKGLRLRMDGRLHTVQLRATADPEELGPQDLVIVAVKGPFLADVAGRIGPLLAPDTMVLTAMNGVPWWFFDGLRGEFEGTRVDAADPGGAIRAGIPTSHVIGCVVYGSFSVPEPGLVQHTTGRKLIIGEPDGGDSPRVRRLAQLFTGAGLEIVVSSRIQADIWYKLWGNMTMNPISAFTGATSDQILDDPLVNDFCLACMDEAAAIAARIGCPISESGVERNRITRDMGSFKTSMLQDAAAGRLIEIDTIVGAVREIGRKVGVPTPHIDILLGLARLHGGVHGLYPWQPGMD